MSKELITLLLYLVSAVSCFILLWKIHFEDECEITLGQVVVKAIISVIPLFNGVLALALMVVMYTPLLVEWLDGMSVWDKVVYREKEGK
jgi:hypothetical protein